MMPGSSSAGSWYVRLFPVPVASTRRLGNPFMARSTPHSCPSRNALCPNTRRSAVAGVKGSSESPPPPVSPSEPAGTSCFLRSFLFRSTASSSSESESQSSESSESSEVSLLLPGAAAAVAVTLLLRRPDALPSASFRLLVRSALRRFDALEGGRRQRTRTGGRQQCEHGGGGLLVRLRGGRSKKAKGLLN